MRKSHLGWRDRISNKSHDKPKTTKPLNKIAESTISVIQEEAKPLMTKFTNPLEFILMREEYVKKNPPTKKTFVKQRSVESDSEGEMSMESVMKSLKKIVKAINPKREFATEIQARPETQKSVANVIDIRARQVAETSKSKSAKSVWDERMKKYYGANIVPFNSHASRWNSCQDLIEEQRIIDKKAVRDRIKNRVLSSVHQALENKIDEIFSYCESKDFNIKGKLNLQPSKYKLSRQTVEQEFVNVYECVEFRKRELPDIIAHFREATKI